MSKTKIAREITIDASPHDVWTALSDFGHVSWMNPNIAASYLTSDQESGVGTTRHCELQAFGASLDERITGWQEDAYLEVDVYKIENMPTLKKMHEYFWIEPEGNKTVLRATFEYEISSDIGSIHNALVIQRTSIKSWNELLAGTKKYVETHAPVDRKSMLHTEQIRTLL